MIHVPIFGVPAEATLAGLFEMARHRYRYAGAYGVKRNLPLIAFEVLPRGKLDPDDFQLSKEPSRLLMIGLERDWGEYVVRQARSLGRRSHPRQVGLMRPEQLMPPTPSQKIGAIFDRMAATNTTVIAFSSRVRTGRPVQIGTVFATGKRAVAQLRRKMQLERHQTLTFLCPAV